MKVMPFFVHLLALPSAIRAHCGYCTWSKHSSVAKDPLPSYREENGVSEPHSLPPFPSTPADQDVAGTSVILGPCHFMLSSHGCVPCPLGTSGPR